MLRDHRSHATGATQPRDHDGQVKQGAQEVLHPRDRVGQTSGATQRCLVSESTGNSRRTGGHTQGATMWMTTVQDGGNTYSVAFRGGEVPNAGAQLFDNPRHPTVVADTQRTLQRLKELAPPDLFLHNHPQDPPQELDPALPVDSRCVTCLDAEGFRTFVAGVEARFDAMLREAEGPGGR